MEDNVNVHYSVIKTLHNVINGLKSKGRKGTPHFRNTEVDAGGLGAGPGDIPILPIQNFVTYPFSVFPLLVDPSQSMKLVEDALKGNRLIGLVSTKDDSIEEQRDVRTYEMGTLAKIHDGFRLPDKTLQVVIEGLERFRIECLLERKSYLRAHISLASDVIEEGLELDALAYSLRYLAQEVFTLSPNLSGEPSNFLSEIEDIRFLTYFVASAAYLEVEKGQQILEMDHIKEKMHALISHLTREKETLILGKKIEAEASKEINRTQREYFLRQQLKAIRKELANTAEGQSEVTAYDEKIKKAHMPDEVKKEAQRELKRLGAMSTQVPEYSLIKTYLDWLLALPWNAVSEDQLDINQAREVLDNDHYGLQEVKERLLEYLAVRKLLKERRFQNKGSAEWHDSKAMGTILCFFGPPGVGKTSLGQSIARALGRTFTRMSLGGMTDEAEIRGHRRTYVGAMPGRIIQALKRAGTRNPVFMLDEVDKIGSGWQGGPTSALLEVLDPAQNRTFRDHYLDLDFDLSEALFITTANQLEPIPPPLRDRMEIIHLDGYTEYEKIRIARDYLVPRQIKTNGLRGGEINFTDDALHKIVRDYTREAGVRNLERHIGAICRKVAVKISAHALEHIEVNPDVVRAYLKKEKFESASSEHTGIPGIALGLAVTDVGGDILFIEAARLNGKGRLTLTGNLGDVMQESAQIALSFVRSKALHLNVGPEIFEKTDLHVHVPEGATPKDGPSAGLAMLASIASVFSGRPVRGDAGMTGEVTLRGRVLPVGGIKMKILAAYRAGLKTVILPKRNEADLEELPEEVRSAMVFVTVERIEEALKVSLLPKRQDLKRPGTKYIEESVWQPEALVNRTDGSEPQNSLPV